MADADRWRALLDSALAEAGVDAFAERAVRILERETPLIADDPDLRALALESTAANLSLVAQVVRQTLPLGATDPPPQAVAFARELARRNVPMTELSRSYRLVQHEMWRFGVREIRARLGDGADAAAVVESYTDATFATGEVMLSAALDRYVVERDRWVRSADAVRRETVDRLLGGGPVDMAAVSARLRYELRREHVAFIVWAAEDVAVEASAAAVGGPGALLIPHGAGSVAGWCAPATLGPGAADGDARVAVGLPGTGLEGFRRSHAEALEARRVAQLAERAGAVAYADVALRALLTSDLDRAQAFARRELGELYPKNASTRRLTDTVLAVLEEQGSPRRAARRLFVHENTVGKRIRAAEKLLGRSIDDRPVELLAALLIVTTAP